MPIRTNIFFASAAVGLALASFGTTSAQAQALSAKDCGVKYQAAKSANSLNGQNYFAFRKAECSAPGSAQPAAAQPAVAQPAAAQANPLRPTPSAAAPAAAAPKPAAAAPAAAGNAVFPKAVDPKYSTLRPAQQRLKTCADQYGVNKATNGNGGMKWIEKGGGYWSACNKAIKV